MEYAAWGATRAIAGPDEVGDRAEAFYVLAKPGKLGGMERSARRTDDKQNLSVGLLSFVPMEEAARGVTDDVM